jgi:hypothetical protein
MPCHATPACPLALAAALCQPPLGQRATGQACPNQRGLHPSIALPHHSHTPCLSCAHARLLAAIMASIAPVRKARSDRPFCSSQVHTYKRVACATCPPYHHCPLPLVRLLLLVPCFLTVTATVDRVPHHLSSSVCRSHRSSSVWCLQLIFFFSSGFFFSMITLLQFAHLVAIILGDFL